MSLTNGPSIMNPRPPRDAPRLGSVAPDPMSRRPRDPLFTTITFASTVGARPVTSRLAISPVLRRSHGVRMWSGVACRRTRCSPCLKPKAHCCGQVYVTPQATWDDKHPPQRGPVDAVSSLTPAGLTAFLCSHPSHEKGVLSGQTSAVEPHRSHCAHGGRTRRRTHRHCAPGATLAPRRSISSGLMRHSIPVSFTVESSMSSPSAELPETSTR